jgi:hypothetical protein
LGIHNKSLFGIDSVKGMPAFAVCMSGGYADDEDTGMEVWYTGMGGQQGKKQVQAQKLVKVRNSQLTPAIYVVSLNVLHDFTRTATLSTLVRKAS